MPDHVQLPLMHLSIRVPWHDNGWNGTVCRNPLANTSCLVLDRVRQTRDDEFEVNHAGERWNELGEGLDRQVGCAAERGAFMAPYAYDKWMVHAYAKGNGNGGSKLHTNFKPTRFEFPEYSASIIPFRWMNKKTLKVMPNPKQNDEDSFNPLEWYGIPFDMSKEPSKEVMGFNNDAPWVQHADNQRLLLDSFASAIIPDESIVFFYAKDTPLTSDPRRVIVGVGSVKFVSDIKEYDTTDNGQHWRGYLWERNIGHSIRPHEHNGFVGGFLLPYQELLDYMDTHPEFDPQDYVALAPQDAWGSFSYVAEHVSHDHAISTLLECRRVLECMKDVIPGRHDVALTWIDEQINRLWKMRGPYPGMGSALRALGVENATLVAYEINRIQSEFGAEYSEDPWQLFIQAMSDPSLLPQSGKYLKGIAPIWAETTDTDRNHLKLLSRFSLTREQAFRYVGREYSDRLLENPYLLYELDRHRLDGITIHTVDRGLYADPIIRKNYPLPEPSEPTSPLDPRRVRAFTIYHLEAAASEGHSLLPRHMLMERLNETELTTGLNVSDPAMDAAEKLFDNDIQSIVLDDGTKAYQLTELTKAAAEIRRIKRRLAARKFDHSYLWENLLSQALGGDPEDSMESAARKEKAEALEKLYSSGFSVLVGAAGTGKTTLLRILCNATDIGDSVLLLAPTGKARVRMETGMNRAGAQTIAQYLNGYGLYDGETSRYFLAEKGLRFDNIPHTVIVDESSMLTEQQLAALLSVVRHARRIILVGDPRQLPPIGTGRPFADISEYIKDYHRDAHAELVISRRQQGDALTFANWFSGRQIAPGDDDIWSRVKISQADNIQTVQWSDPFDLQQKLFNALRQYIHKPGIDDELSFGESLGGTIWNQEQVYFNRGNTSESAENWQILSPVRGDLHGVRALNREIQRRFKASVRSYVTSPNLPRNKRKFPVPIGPEEIIYGDKVINVVNHARDNTFNTPGGKYMVYPTEGALNYVANGEIGIVVGQSRSKGRNWYPENLEIEFASQPNYCYAFQPWEFSEHGTPPLELAYALTIHKAQGSEFDVVFLIVPNPSFLLSRELLYTALTRQKERVILFHQGEFDDLRRYTDSQFSDIARRMTNLFDEPQPINVTPENEKARYMEHRLIHRTANGVMMRSKSEVILASMFDRYALEHDIDIQWDYEKPFRGKLPDFTIDDPYNRRTIYWEHLGMLHVPHYAHKWEIKKQWYREQGVVPLEENDQYNDVLVTTHDDGKGGFDEQAIDEVLASLFPDPY